jgi:hypothetical protein
MRKYQQIQPKVKEICERYGLPYAQEGVFKRARRLIDIMVGNTSMKRVERVVKATPERSAAQAAE